MSQGVPIVRPLEHNHCILVKFQHSFKQIKFYSRDHEKGHIYDN